MPSYRRKIFFRAGGVPAAQLYAVTTGAQTVTIQRWTASRDQWINWGDGTAATLVPAGSTGSITHNYAGAGTYPITISGNAADVTHVRIDDIKIGFNAGTVGRWRNLTTLVLNHNGIGGTYTNAYVSAGEISQLRALTTLHLARTPNVVIAGGEISSPPALNALYLSFVSATISAGEIGSMASRLTWLVLSNVAGATIGSGEIGSLSLVTYLALINVPGITIASGEIDNLLSCVELYLINLPNATIGADEIGNLGTAGGASRPIAVSIVGLPNCAFQIGLSALRRVTNVSYINNLTQAQVDSVLAQLYAAFPTRSVSGGTINLSSSGGYTNAAPSGVYQAACPPATGREYAYELINDSCGVSSNHWSTVTLTP